MTIVYLHIGTSKTGTTFWQNFLFKNKEKLLENGFLFPLSGIPKRNGVIGSPARYSQHNLAWILTKDKNKAFDPSGGDWKDVLREINSTKAKKIVISSEFFSINLDFNEVSLVRDYLSDYEIKVIAYVRRQDDYFVSSYCQHIKSCKYEKDINTYILENKHRGNYRRLLEPWKNCFGNNNLILRVYERQKLSNQNSIIDDFCKLIDLKTSQTKLNYPQPHNLSPNIKVIKIMRFLNDVSGKMSVDKTKMRKLYYLYLICPDSKIQDIISKLPDSLINPELLTIQQRIDLMKEFEDSNRKLAQEYLGREDGKLFDSTLEQIT